MVHLQALPAAALVIILLEKYACTSPEETSVELSQVHARNAKPVGIIISLPYCLKQGELAENR